MKESGKEVTKVTGKEVAAQAQSMNQAGISASDLLISRIGVMNALSEMVKSGQFRIGDIVDTSAEEKLGDATSNVDFIVLKSFKYWTQTKDKEFVKGSYQPAISNNDKPWTEAGNIKNIFNHSFYVLLKKDLEEGVEIPYTINFRSTEVKKAKRICTIIYRMLQQGNPCYANYFELSTKEERSGKDSWFGAKIGVGQAVPVEIQNRSAKMLDMINSSEASGTIKHTDDADLESADVPF